MAKPIAVTNTSPIIALVGVGELRLLDSLFDRILVPMAVWDELVDKPGAPEPETLRALAGARFEPPQSVPPSLAYLDPGERAAIALALATPNCFVLLDDLAARHAAAALKLPVRGTLGVLVEAKRQQLIPVVRPLVERMLANGCRLGTELVSAVLASVGEG